MKHLFNFDKIVLKTKLKTLNVVLFLEIFSGSIDTATRNTGVTYGPDIQVVDERE